jgi:uncharacterized protein (UPF0264 family)
MRLLVSVTDAADARAAIAGGADVIDAKDPARGALGAVSPAGLRAIAAAIGGVRPMSVALGDAGRAIAEARAMCGRPGDEGTGRRAEYCGEDQADYRGEDLAEAGEFDSQTGRGWGDSMERVARAAAAAGAEFVKLGFGCGVSVAMAGEHASRVMAAVASAGTERGTGNTRVATVARAGCRVVLATYADPKAGQLDRFGVLEVAVGSGVAGVLLDTQEKGDGRGRLFELLTPESVAAWIEGAHAAGLTVALAGSLRAVDFAIAGLAGADLVGVRGAACEGGRRGRVSPRRVEALAASLSGVRVVF